MALEGRLRQLLDEVKYKQKFPPHDKAIIIKNNLSAKGMGDSRALVESVSTAYVEAVENALEEFGDIVIARAAGLGLTNIAELRGAVADAHQQLFDDGRNALLDEFKGSRSYSAMAAGIIDARRGPVWEHLERKLELATLDEAKPALQKEREQKFGILLSPRQAARDFEAWAAEATKWGNPVAVFFVDVDHFKALVHRNVGTDST